MAGIYAPPNGIGVSELSQRQQQLHANWPASEAFDELPHRLGHLMPFSDPLLRFMRHVLGGITRPALQRIESHHVQGMVVLSRLWLRGRIIQSNQSFDRIGARLGSTQG